jgi:hypothetical protein
MKMLPPYSRTNSYGSNKQAKAKLFFNDVLLVFERNNAGLKKLSSFT